MSWSSEALGLPLRLQNQCSQWLFLRCQRLLIVFGLVVCCLKLGNVELMEHCGSDSSHSSQIAPLKSAAMALPLRLMQSLLECLKEVSSVPHYSSSSSMISMWIVYIAVLCCRRYCAVAFASCVRAWCWQGATSDCTSENHNMGIGMANDLQCEEELRGGV